MADQHGLPDNLEELFGLTGKVALVLGGGFGMGEQVCLWLARAGCDVIVADILPERAAAVAAKVRDLGRRAHEAVGDMCEQAVVDSVLSAAETALGGIDILVSIIGEAGWFSVLETTLEDWKYDQRRNLDYFFLGAQYAARSMVNRGVAGRICAIASVDGMQASPMHGAYGAAKAGLISLVKTLAIELGPDGIRVNCVAPGMTKTPRALARRPAADIDANARQMGIPLGRAGEPREVAQAILFLVSDMSRYVTGVTLPVDGGWLSARLDVGNFTNRR